jgi:hypothetical protein
MPDDPKIPSGSNVELLNGPGQFYAGCLCCAEHWVVHSDDQDPNTLYMTDRGDRVMVNWLLRCGTFRQTHGTSGKTGPNPHLVFAAALGALNKALSSRTWRLPELLACEKFLAAQSAAT